MRKFKRILILKSIFFITINIFYPFKYVYAQNLNSSNSERKVHIENSDNQEKDLQKDSYILGPGDQITIEIIGTEIDKSIYNILNDGSLSIPLAGDFYFTGKTILQAKKEIIEGLKEQILIPEVAVILAKPRPVSVFVIGEVNNPGIYNLAIDGGTSSTESNNILSEVKLGSSGLPTIVSAIKSAGGITQDTNLREVELIRLLPGNNNEYKKTELNLIDLLFEGKMQNNPYLFDGDIIKFKKAQEQIPPNINIITSNNLSPSTIAVSVIGEVKSPGEILLSKNTALFQSILKAGGPTNSRYSKANVDLFRINKNGSVAHKKYKIDFRKGTSPDNPILKNGDVVRVRRNLLAKSSDTLSTVTSPLQSAVTIWSIFKIFE